MLRLLVLAAAFSVALSSQSLPASRLLLLEVVVNSHATGQVAEFEDRDGHLLAQAGELRAIGLVVPPARNDELIALRSLPGLSHRIEESTQTLLLTAGAETLESQTLSGGEDPSASPAESGTGMVLNYDVLTSRGGSAISSSGLADGRLFGPWGLVVTDVLTTAGGGENSIVRLDSFYAVSDPASLRRWRVGDLITGGLDWNRPVRLGGVQASIDFGLQPELVTFPVPNISGQANVPSTVDVLVNGVRQLSRDVAPGPFEIRQLPIITGAGDVAVVVTDARGQQTTQVLPFYASQELLKPGLTAYSAEFGAVRRKFGLASNDYSDPAGSLTWRRGLSNELTLEAHGEATQNLAMAGAGMQLGLGSLGVASVAAAASGSSAGARGLVSLGFERIARPLSVTGSLTLAQSGFADIAADYGAPVPRSVARVALGLSLGAIGSLGLAYTGLRQDPGDDRFDDSALISASFTTELFERVHAYATAFSDLEQQDVSGFMIGLSVPLGARASAGSSLGRSSGSFAGTTQASRPAVEVGDAGWQLLAQSGEPARQLAQGEYKAATGRFRLGADRIQDDTWLRAGVEGALVLLDGHVFAANRIDDSFAVVSTGAPGVSVLRENRPVGRSGADGRLLVTDLRSFEPNRLAIDPTDVPLDADVGDTTRLVRPKERSGVVVPFPVQQGRGALIRLVDPGGTAVEVGSVAQLGSSGISVPVGYDGEVFLEDLQARDTVVVTKPDGRRCRVGFAFTPRLGTLPEIGPLVCRPGAPP